MPSQLLNNVQRGEFVGEFKESSEISDTRVPVVDVYRGHIPDATRTALGASGLDVYEFTPLPGDGQDVEGEPFAIAALSNVHREKDGHVGARLALLVPGAESVGNDTANPVLEGKTRFTRLLRVIAEEGGEPIDRLYVEPGDTNLQPDAARALGLQPVEEGSTTLKLDLPESPLHTVAF